MIHIFLTGRNKMARFINEIPNATPNVVYRGTDDRSTRQVIPNVLETPQHCPKFFLMTQKGPMEPMLVDGSLMTELYGAYSFDPRSPYFNHQTLFANLVVGEGNNVVIQRCVPADANPPANATLYIDVVKDNIPNYLRNSDGSIVEDQDGNKQVDAITPTIEGYRVKFIKEVNNDAVGLQLGAQTMRTGTMVSSINGELSKMYPILDTKASYCGEKGNDTGYRLYPIVNYDIPEKHITIAKSFPYYFSLVQRANSNSSTVPVENNYNEENIYVSLKKNAINPYTDSVYSLDDLVPAQYNNTLDSGMALKISDLGDIHVYYDYVQQVLNLLLTMEAPYISTTPQTWEDDIPEATINWFDFNTDDQNILLTEDLFLFNLLSGESTKGVKYFTYMLDNSTPTFTDPTFQCEVTMGQYSDIMLENGTDGFLTNENYEEEVINYVREYNDIDSKVIDMALNPESTIYDTGFTLDTKYELCNFISIRPDTVIKLCTYDASRQVPLTVSEEISLATSLRTRLRLTPESDYFGTPVMRGVVAAQTGKITNMNYYCRVPLLAEIAIKSARYMGAGNGKWKNGFNFDYRPGSEVNTLTDIQPDFIPGSARYEMWDRGLVYVQSYDRGNYFFPAIQTIYDNDTSVLNSYFTMYAIAFLNKIAYQAWSRFSGVTSMTNRMLKKNVEDYVTSLLLNRYDGNFVITPEVIFTTADEQRGYSWTLVFKIYSPNMKTVMTTHVEAYRLDDLTN